MTLATYAVKPENSRGRLYPDFQNIVRSPFQRDRDRIIHSSAFRHLSGKTQVFAYHEGKNYRTRLTHSIEVSQITRTVCRNLDLNEDLGEAIALAHDLGHPPFGHAGEKGLSDAMKEYGGFDHNIQSFKVVTKIETHYPQFEGLNLSWEILEGLAKHNGPVKKVSNGYLKDFNCKFDLDLKTFPSLEAQIASLADDIAYNNHDIDDGFRAGFFTIKDLQQIPFIDEMVKDFDKEYTGCDNRVKIYNITRNTISRMVFDLLENTKKNMEKHKIKSVDDIRKHDGMLADFSVRLKKELAELKKFLLDILYRSPAVAAMDIKSQKLVRDLFGIFMGNTLLLPIEQRNKLIDAVNKNKVAEAVSEFIADMTDMKALDEHEKLFNLYRRF